MSNEYLSILIILAIIIAIAVGFTIASQHFPSKDEITNNDNNMTPKEVVRQPAVAGSFYPAGKKELESMIAGFLKNAVKEGQVSQILIVPHAGYPYSGQVAAHSFKQLEGSNYKKAILIGPSHNFSVSGLFLSNATHWRTPLGLVKIADINSQLAKENNFTINDEVHKPEHALEVEIPFLQTVAPNIEIVPIIIGRLNAEQQLEFAAVLNQYLDSETVLVVSVDLSHYHEYDEAVELDNQSIKHILDLDSRGILADEIDAPWAVASVLELAKRNSWQPKLLKYANSGDVMGDKSQPVVGYAALGFFVREARDKEEYSEAEKRKLLQVARMTIKKYLEDGEEYQVEADNPKFQEKRGVFVTLNKNGTLRGCIGYIEPVKPLIEAVRDNAISAAVHDNRFSPVAAGELDEIKIEISVLTVPAPDILEEIIKNKKGVVLKKGGYQATYLPQVWGGLPDPDEFFSSLCLKAGLPNECYQNADIELFSYEAIIFHE